MSLVYTVMTATTAKTTTEAIDLTALLTPPKCKQMPENNERCSMSMHPNQTQKLKPTKSNR